MTDRSRPIIAMYSTADSWRGAAVSYVNIARGLEQYGYRPHLIVTSVEMARQFAAAGMDVSRLPSQHRFQGLQLRRRLIELGARLVIVDRAHDLRVATRAVLGTRISILNRYNLFRQSPPDDFLTRVAYKDFVKEIVFLSHSQRAQVLAAAPFMCATTATTIHEGVDSDLFKPSSAAADLFRKTFRIATPFLLAVGALSAEKRYDFMFESLALLGDAAPDLVICGEGNEEDRLRHRASVVGVKARFLGRIPYAELPGAYNASIGLIHTCCVETFGLSVLEAMSCGAPVVASHGGALPELIGTDGAAGTLVDSMSAADLANATQCIVSEPDQSAAIGVRARERALRFSLSAMQKSYAELVERNVQGGAI